jgi:hypothetical protein
MPTMMPSVNRSAWTQHRGTNIIGAGFLDDGVKYHVRRHHGFQFNCLRAGADYDHRKWILVFPRIVGIQGREGSRASSLKRHDTAFVPQTQPFWL